MTRILAMGLAAVFVLASCGIDGEPLTPAAKSTRTAAFVPV